MTARHGHDLWPMAADELDRDRLDVASRRTIHPAWRGNGGGFRQFGQHPSSKVDVRDSLRAAATLLAPLPPAMAANCGRDCRPRAPRVSIRARDRNQASHRQDRMIEYMPDELVVVFDARLARGYRPRGVRDSACGQPVSKRLD